VVALPSVVGNGAAHGGVIRSVRDIRMSRRPRLDELDLFDDQGRLDESADADYQADLEDLFNDANGG
jgi:hypothetical protein